MRAVLDTNVLISAVIATGTPHEVVVRGYRGDYRIVVSTETVAEFQETLANYPDRFRMDDEEIRREVETLRYFAEFVTPDESLRVVEPDPDDDEFLETALAGNVGYLVSGDQHLLDVERFRGIEIVDPRTFLDLLDEGAGDVGPECIGVTDSRSVSVLTTGYVSHTRWQCRTARGSRPPSPPGRTRLPHWSPRVQSLRPRAPRRRPPRTHRRPPPAPPGGDRR